MTNPEQWPRIPEVNEESFLFGVLGLLHHHVANALRYEERLRVASVEARKPAIRKESYAPMVYEDNEHALGKHNHIVMVPEEGAEPLHGITRIDLRAPELVPLVDANEAMEHPHWNDLFVELHTVDDDRQDYLVNGLGMQPFVNARTDVKPSLAGNLQPDLYVVAEMPISVPRAMINLAQFEEIMDAYVYMRRDQPPVSPGGLESAS